MVNSGWACHAIDLGIPDRSCMLFRTEDFVGAHSLHPDRWPDINIDSELVATRYFWDPPGFNVGFHDTLPCLPEVNWSVAGYGAEIMYLYKSIHGADHPLGNTGEFDYVMEGTPVGHRFNPSLFRTVHFNFTPLAISNKPGNSTGSQESEIQTLVDTVLNWLYDPSLIAPVSKERYPNAPVKLSISEQRQRYWERNDRWARENGEILDPRLQNKK
jgi:hypothetical protein